MIDIATLQFRRSAKVARQYIPFFGIGWNQIIFGVFLGFKFDTIFVASFWYLQIKYSIRTAFFKIFQIVPRRTIKGYQTIWAFKRQASIRRIITYFHRDTWWHNTWRDAIVDYSLELFSNWISIQGLEFELLRILLVLGQNLLILEFITTLC